MNMADWLSQNKVIGLSIKTSSSCNNLTNQVTSDAALDMALYSASELDLDTVCYFLLFQLMGELPSIMIYPVIDLLVSIQDPQSESEYACNTSLSCAFNFIPWPQVKWT